MSRIVTRSVVAAVLSVQERPAEGWSETSVPLGPERIINVWCGDALDWSRDTVQYNAITQAEQFTANDVRLWQYADVCPPQEQIEQCFGGTR